MKTYIRNTLALSQIKKIAVIFTALFTLGCSTSNVGIQYYSLNSIEAKPKMPLSIEHDINTAYLIMSTVELADFLNTGGLVMQINSHQIQISNQHLWGDKLSKAITTHLIYSLTDNAKNIYIEKRNSTNESLADISLEVSFNQFTVTNTNETIISGFYLIESGLNTQDKQVKQSKKSFFDIRQPLTQDGYNHAVETFIVSLNHLSNKIQKDLPESN